MVLGALRVEKSNFQELHYVIDHEKYFGKQICDLKSVMSRVELGKSLVFSSFLKEVDACSFLYVIDPYASLKLESFQQGESYIDSRSSLFQQKEFDTSVSSFLIKEIGTWECMVDSNLRGRDFVFIWKI